MAIVYCALVAVNLILGFSGKKNRLIIFLSYFLIILLMSLNTKGPDIGNYIIDYTGSNGKVIIAEKGYVLLRRLFSEVLHFDFFAFHMAIIIVCIILIRSTVCYLKANENCVIGLFMSYLFFVDTIQIRNFIVEAIFIFAFRFLFENKKFNALKYILCIVVAYFFHKIALGYMLFLICKLKNKKTLIKFSFVAALIAFMFFAVFRESLKSIILFITEFLGFKDSYSFTSTRFSFIPIVFIYLLELYIIYYFKTKITSEKFSDKESQYLNCLLEVQMLLTVSLCLLLINMNYYRVIRNLLIIKYIAYSLYFSKLKKFNILKYKLTVLVLFSCVIWFVSDYILINDFAVIVQPIFTGNLIFDSKVNEMDYSIVNKLLIILIASTLFSLKKRFYFKNKCNSY